MLTGEPMRSFQEADHVDVVEVGEEPAVLAGLIATEVMATEEGVEGGVE